MTTFQLSRRLLIAGAFTAAIAAAPVISAVGAHDHAAASVAACPNGESTDVYAQVCLPDLVPNSPELSSPGGLPEVDNIPCTGANSGQCIGLSEEQQAEGPIAVPRSSVSSSP